MKKGMQREDELVTRGILKSELHKLTKKFDYKFTLVRREIKRGDGNLRREMHETEYRAFLRFNAIDKRFDSIDELLKKHLDTIRELADKVIVAHQNFETESVSIHHNYQHLENRVKKVEEIIFPYSDTQA